MFTRFQIARRLASGGLLPRTRTAWFTLYFAGIELLLLLMKFAFKAAGALRAVASLDSWTGFLGLVLILLLAFLFLRWFRKYVMWRLRNRLIVT